MSNSRWLDVEVGIDHTELDTLPSNLATVDLQNDGDHKLLVGDFGKIDDSPQLKVFRGATQISDIILPDIPIAVVGVYTSDTVPRTIPIIAVAFSSCVCVYRNMKMFYKYYIPPVELDPVELSVWKQLIDPRNQNIETLSILTENLRTVDEDLKTEQTKIFLRLKSEQQLQYLEENSVLPTKRPGEITCMAAMKFSSLDDNAMSCLVLGTENGDVHILDPQIFSLIYKAKLCEPDKTPYQIITRGLYSVDYRIIVAMREKCIYLLKREWKEGRLVIRTEDHIVSIDLMEHDNSIIVICINNSLACYSKKGTKLWSISLDSRPIALTLLPIKDLAITLVGVALSSGHIQLYNGKALVDSIFVKDVASVIKFGQLGREEHVLIIITGGGSLMLKILKRTAEFNAQSPSMESISSPSPHSRPWLIPKKSKLFLEQSARERDNPIAMHETFQLELNRLRLKATQSLIEAYGKSENYIGAGAMEPIRLSAEVEGLGPVFKVTLCVENTSSDKAVAGLSFLFHLHKTSYKVNNPYIKIPLLSPGSKLKFPTKVEEIFDNISPDVYFRTVTGMGGERSIIKILLLKDGLTKPVLAASVEMPPTDPMMVPFDKINASQGFG